MITLTIDQDIKLKKTHFADPLEAIYFLAAIQIKKMKTNETEVYGSNTKKALEEYRKGKNICDEKDLKGLLKKRGIIQ